MELTTFGAAIKFAIDLETQVMNVYEDAAGAAKRAETRDTFVAFSVANKKRKAMLERLYNENVYSDQDTGIFEPIPGLKGTDYLINTESTSELNYSDILVLAMEMEEKSNSFCLDMVAQLKSRRRGVSRIFEKMAQENYDRRLNLKSLNDSLLSGRKKSLFREIV